MKLRRGSIVGLSLLLVVGLFLSGTTVLAQNGVDAAVKEELGNYLNEMPEDYNVIFPKSVNFKLKKGDELFILDVREPEEFTEGHLPEAVNIPIRSVMENLEKLPDNDTLIVVYCKTGIRAAYVTEALQVLGYDAKTLVMGITGWKDNGYRVKK